MNPVTAVEVKVPDNFRGTLSKKPPYKKPKKPPNSHLILNHVKLLS